MENIMEGCCCVLNWSTFGDLFGGTLSIWLFGANDREIKANMEQVWNEFWDTKTEFLAEKPVSLMYYSCSCLEVWWKSWNNEIRRSFTLILIIKPTRFTIFSNLFLEWDSTCFGQSLCPSSGVQHSAHSKTYRLCWLLASTSASKQSV
jgi:hypothetical protein